MKRAMLEAVGSGAVQSPEDVEGYITCTLLAACSDYQSGVAEPTKAALKWLGAKGLIRCDTTAISRCIFSVWEGRVLLWT